VLKYRPDIDGLRALAVVPVVLFHADVALFSGGFVGVDIFFVISGYLITAMLLQDLAAGRFSIIDFYVHRARRILPALLAMVTATLLAGFFLLLPNELEQAAKAARRIAVFASNHLFWHTQNDYWQQNTLANQPLLHTWSLAVEEQFYFIIPVLLLVCFKIRQRFGVLTALVLLSIASFSVSQYWLSTQTAAAFYLLPSRAFELFIGAILAVTLQRGNKQSQFTNQCLGSIGLAAIGASIFYYHDRMPFPGMAALLPCLGAAAIIYAGASHHPEKASWVFLIVIFLLAWASWRWVERPFRVRKRAAGKNDQVSVSIPPPPVVALISCWGLGAGAKKLISYQPLPTILADFARVVSVPPGKRCEGKADVNAILAGVSGCVLGVPSHLDNPSFLLIGDSHAVMWTEALDALGKEHQQSIVLMGYSSCTPLIDYVAPTRKECASLFTHALKYIIRSPIQNIVLGGYWLNAARSINFSTENNDGFANLLEKTIVTLQQAGKQVAIIRDIPELKSDQQVRERTLQSLRHAGATMTATTLMQHEEHQRPVSEAITAISEKYGVTVIDPATIICPDNQCVVAEGGITLYQDKHHLTDAAARRFRQIFEPLLLNQH